MNMNTDSFQNFSIKNKKASKTISRVMSWTFIYPVLLLPADSSDQPEAWRAAIPLLFGLASDGVYICPVCYHPGGSLLHCPSNLTCICRRYISVALSLESPLPDVIRHPALWSPDFPHLRSFDTCSRDHLPYLFSGSTSLSCRQLFYYTLSFLFSQVFFTR